jgi:two-component system, LytTR family, sensor kinase
MKNKGIFCETLGFDDRWLLIGGIPVAGFLMSVLLFNNAYINHEWDVLMVCLPMSLVYTGVFWVSLRWAYHIIRTRYPESKDIFKRIAWIFGAFLIVFAFVNTSLDAFFKWALPFHREIDNIIVEFIGSLILSALTITIYEAVAFAQGLHKVEAEKTELQRHFVQSQLEGLRNQVNPHFLFNSLNTLTYLIPEDPDRAVNFVQKLSKVYRYVLESRVAAVIPLRDEIEYLNAYIYLLRERFGESLQVNIAELNGQSNASIVPLTLQILFENAIKHNVISVEKPLKIEVFPENGHLTVRNNLQLKNQVMDSTGVGLENIRARYRILTQQEIGVDISTDYFTVSLPVIK